MRFTKASVAIVSVVAVVFATTVDWKYSVGRNGTVLDPLSIGVPASPDVVRSSLVVCSSPALYIATPHAIAQPCTSGGVLFCTDIDWDGTYGYAVQSLGVCIFLTSPWYHTISSVGPDPGTTCFGQYLLLPFPFG